MGGGKASLISDSPDPPAPGSHQAVSLNDCALTWIQIASASRQITGKLRLLPASVAAVWVIQSKPGMAVDAK